MPETRDQRARKNLGSAAVLLALIMSWWFLLAPPALGGRTTMIIVDGSSMEPLLLRGDLAIARTRQAYQVGDLVVYRIQGGMLIHRIVAGSAGDGWQTQGDNNPHPDTWVVPNDTIAGQYLFKVPRLGSALRWILTKPLAFGAAAGTAVLLTFIPVRRRKVSPVLAEALTRAQRERRGAGRSSTDYALFALAGIGTLATGVVVLLGFMSRTWTWAVMASGLAFLVVGGVFFWLSHRLFDGAGIPEPAKSNYALSERLWLVEEFPDLEESAKPVVSAVAMRKIAEKYRLPILHTIDAETGVEAFLLITVQEGSYIWRPGPARAVRFP